MTNVEQNVGRPLAKGLFALVASLVLVAGCGRPATTQAQQSDTASSVASAANGASSAASSPTPSRSHPPSTTTDHPTAVVSTSILSPAPSTGVCPDPTGIIDLAAVQKESKQAPGTKAPVIASYGGHFDTPDPRNFVAQISGSEAIAAKIKLGPEVKADDRIVVIVWYGTFLQDDTERPPVAPTTLPRIYNVKFVAQDITSGEPALTTAVLPGCTTTS